MSGSFTAQAKGPGSGVVLVEVYDPAPGGAARLINRSARNQVGTGETILIAGFTLSGRDTAQIRIRGVGPGLTQFGITGGLANPKLEIFEGNISTPIATNDDWRDAVASVFPLVGAAPIAAGSKDAAAIVTVRAGPGYPTQVSGSTGGTGFR